MKYSSDQDNTLEFFLEELTLRVQAALEAKPYLAMHELGCFVEQIHTILADTLGFDDKVRIKEWHTQFKKHGIEVHASLYQHLDAIYGMRNMASHPNHERDLITKDQVERDLGTAKDSLQNLSLQVDKFSFLDKLFEQQVLYYAQKQAATLFKAMKIVGADDVVEAGIIEYATPVLSLNLPANTKYTSCLIKNILLGLASYSRNTCNHLIQLAEYIQQRLLAAKDKEPLHHWLKENDPLVVKNRNTEHPVDDSISAGKKKRKYFWYLLSFIVIAIVIYFTWFFPKAEKICKGERGGKIAPLCQKQSGICQGSQKSCINGHWQECRTSDYKKNNAHYNDKEVCDGIDNNCDGQIDEDAPACVTTFAGTGEKGFRNGPAHAAQFHYPHGLAIDADDNIYVADKFNHSIRKIDRQGDVTTVAGTGYVGHTNGPAKHALFNTPHDVEVDQKGNIYVADWGNHSIRKIDQQGNVTTVAGVGYSGYKDGPAKQALFNHPGGVAVDSLGNIYVGDHYNHRVRKISVTAQVSTVAPRIPFRYPHGVVLDSFGNLYVVDLGRYVVRKIGTQGKIESSPGFNRPTDIALDKTGNAYITDTKNQCIRKMDSNGNFFTFAGIGIPGFQNGPSMQARFNNPTGITIDSQGNLYVTDYQNHQIRKITVAK